MKDIEEMIELENIVTHHQENLTRLIEPQKVVVPKFVAEWIEELKESYSNLAWVWQVYPNEPKIKNWLESNTEKFMRAWLDGYEVEKEKIEPQKVVVPKFVAEWIEELKESYSNLAWIWPVYPNEPKIKNWLESNTEKFMRAWLDGYEVEKEKQE